ncbi:hypothetical protein LGL08_20645 [Clostridium estertheticum]|uniref:hypothetical protein n=1 Tax=Clostridium estertheticum TaxID=238834 RepID=UPI001CF25CE3|nr:hypothetical protein [Clostridium estertheticum]MCB2308882.1 hypothetical protein [Clostridium estertheticum]MCB2347294.1 hypothetical protein [Clostridium estertheticum]MCB2351939.1 hypothetical protein [Clostridium estertheticum]WAG48496.1 hypothetical protein LL127_23535 [Clostridium estertheticum]
MNTTNIALISAVAKLNSEYVNIELGRTNFADITTIDEIARTFGMALKDVDNEFKLLKDTKYKYDEFCDLCDEGKEDEYKKLSEVFEYLEIQKFAEMIVKEVAKSLQARIYREFGFDIKTLTEVSEQNGIPLKTLQSRLTRLDEGVEYKRLGKRQATILSPEGAETIIK